MRPLGRIIGAAQSGKDILDQACPAPNGSTTLRGWFKRLALLIVSKRLVDGDVVEVTRTEYVLGVKIPTSKQDLAMMPEGERSWTYNTLFTEEPLSLNPDDQLLYQGVKYRILRVPNADEYGYNKYYMVNDYTPQQVRP